MSLPRLGNSPPIDPPMGGWHQKAGFGTYRALIVVLTMIAILLSTPYFLGPLFALHGGGQQYGGLQVVSEVWEPGTYMVEYKAIQSVVDVSLRELFFIEAILVSGEGLVSDCVFVFHGTFVRAFLLAHTADSRACHLSKERSNERLSSTALQDANRSELVNDVAFKGLIFIASEYGISEEEKPSLFM